MALAYVVQRITRYSISALEALISELGLIPISQFLGCGVLRRKNIMPFNWAHTVADWVVAPV